MALLAPAIASRSGVSRMIESAVSRAIIHKKVHMLLQRLIVGITKDLQPNWFLLHALLGFTNTFAYFLLESSFVVSPHHLYRMEVNKQRIRQKISSNLLRHPRTYRSINVGRRFIVRIRKHRDH